MTENSKGEADAPPSKDSGAVNGARLGFPFSEDYPAQEDTTFSGSLKNSGAPSVFTE